MRIKSEVNHTTVFSDIQTYKDTDTQHLQRAGQTCLRGRLLPAVVCVGDMLI